MDLFLVALVASLSIAILLVLSNSLHGKFTNDHDFTSIQKFHLDPVPRIGGLALFGGLFFVFLYIRQHPEIPVVNVAKLMLAGLPILLIGLMEDVTKKISAKTRLYVSFMSAALAYSLVHVSFARVDWPLLDTYFFILPAASFVMTLLVIGGTIHAMNLIDGFNGLMLGVSALMLSAIAVICLRVDDIYLFNTILCFLGIIVGLFLVNFPLGKIFAGDGGAYFVGFLMSISVLLLVQRNPSVSAWFPCLLISYPIFETLFSIYRKVYLRNMGAMQPDGVHLHMLVYKRKVKYKAFSGSTLNNAMTSPYLWMLSLFGVVPAVIFYDSTYLTILCCFAFIIVYLRIYWGMVTFKDPARFYRVTNIVSKNSELSKELS